MDNKISVSAQVKRAYTDTGYVFLLIGILDVICLFLKDLGLIYEIMDWVSVLMMAVVLFLICKTVKAEREVFDELAEGNLLRAKSKTIGKVKMLLIYLMIVVCVLEMFSRNLEWNLTFYDVFKPMAYMLIGYIDISIGYYFRKYEAE